MRRGHRVTAPVFTRRSLWSSAGIHSIIRYLGKIERRAARRIFLTCFGALARVRCAAFFPLRRAFLSTLGASSKKRINADHLRIRIAQPTITTGYLAFGACSVFARAILAE